MKHQAKITWILVAALLLTLLPTAFREQVYAASSGEIQSQIDALEAENQSIQDEITKLEEQTVENRTEIENLVAEKNSLDKQISLLHKQMRLTEEQISKYSLLIADKQDELDEARARLAELTEQNRERIRAMEENGPISYWSVLFKANSFSDFLDRLNMVREIAASDSRRIREMNAASKAVEDARDALEADKAKLEEARAGQEENKKSLMEKRDQSDEVLTELLARGDEYQQLIANSKDRMNELLNEIAQKEIEHTEALRQEWEAAHPTTEPPTTAPTVPKPAPTDPETGEPEETEPDSTEPEQTEPEEPEEPSVPDDSGEYFPPCSASWTMPVSYSCITSPFSDGRMHPVLGYVRPHNGIDLGASYGSPIYAARSGYVTVADYEWDGAGNYVFINHGDGFSTVYMHMDHYVVDAGDYVSAGEVIGYVGTSGLSTGPHLHFGISYNGKYYNPAHYINF